METMKTEIRWMQRRDLTQVLRIDRLVSIDSLTAPELLELMSSRKVIGLVVENDKCEIVGFLIYELLDKALRIVRVAIAEEWQRLGLGRQFVNRLVSKLGLHRHRLECQVPESNLAAQLWLRACGGRCTEIVAGVEEPRYHFVITPSRA